MLLFFLLALLLSWSITFSDVVQRSCNQNSGKCFSLITGSSEWSEAENFCYNQFQDGTIPTLASITSPQDEDIIAYFLQHPSLNTNVWIGGFAFGGQSFLWSDGNPFSLTNWAPGQPPTHADGCLQMCLKNDSSCVQGKWTVVSCTIKQSFICQSFIQYTSEDCLELHRKYSNLPSGSYFLTPQSVPAFEAYCEMGIDGGGWTVFQRRMDSTVSFHTKTWDEYKKGFNNGLNHNLWLGNDNIHVLSTKDSNVELRIDLWGDRTPGSNNPNGYWFGKFTSFYIDNETQFYTFHLSSSSTGNASTSEIPYGINYNNGKKFSTIDVNHDNYNAGCVSEELGGWWLDACTWGSLNGKYLPKSWPNALGFGWCWTDTPTSTAHCVHPKQSRMMLRKIDNEAKFYTFHLSSSSTGNASTSEAPYGINYNNGKKFSTTDANHDNFNAACLPYELGGWWLDACTWGSLNGKYLPNSSPSAVDFGWCWMDGKDSHCIHPKQSRMMLRKIM